jgi:hypothetical protein
MQALDTSAANASHPADAAAVRAQRIAAQHAQTLRHYSGPQIGAVTMLYEHVRRHPGTSGSRVCAKFLLGLYNGTRFPFDLTDLRALDCDLFEAAMVVLRADARQTWCEVHVLLDAIYADGRYTGHELELWAWNLRLKGRCKKEAVAELGSLTGAWA